MARVTDPLALFGTQAYGRSGGRLPMTILGASDPVPVRYTTPVPSAQVKSAVLLAGLNAPGAKDSRTSTPTSGFASIFALLTTGICRELRLWGFLDNGLSESSSMRHRINRRFSSRCLIAENRSID